MNSLTAGPGGWIEGPMFCRGADGLVVCHRAAGAVLKAKSPCLFLLMLSVPAILPAQQALNLAPVTEQHVMIPMRDGIKLSTYIYLPPGNGPWPVLYEQRYSDLRGASSRKNYAALAMKGYVIAAENFRGAQLSEGKYTGYRDLGWGERKDGYDTVAWLGKEPRSKRKIGPIGGSQ